MTTEPKQTNLADIDTKLAFAIKPLRGRVAVRKIKPDEKRDGIIIPDEYLSKQSESYEAVIFAVGDGNVTLSTGTEIQMQVDMGDHVLVWKHGGTPFKLYDEECAFVTEDEIQAILELPDDVKVE